MSKGGFEGALGFRPVYAGTQVCSYVQVCAYLSYLIIISCKITELIPTLFCNYLTKQQRQFSELGMVSQYGREKFFASGSEFFFSWWIGRENWPVGQQINPLANGPS